MPRSRFWFSFLVFLLVFPALAAERRRAVQHPQPLTPDVIIAAATRVADSVVIDFDPRLHWENAVDLDGLVLVGEQLNLRARGSGDRFIERAASVLLDSHDAIDPVDWGDRTAFVQAAMDLYRVLPPSDGRRGALLALTNGPMSFAQHAIRVAPADGPPRDPWWIDGGYGVRFWQDDIYMVVPWLSLYASTHDGMPGNELARSLAYEWIESYVYDHRPIANDPRERAVPSSKSRRGPLLWDEAHGLFLHEPDSLGNGDNFWGRGNGWALAGMQRAVESLDAPYSGDRYDEIITTGELKAILRTAAASLLQRRSPDGGWGTFLTRPDQCPIAETSATALLTFFLARGVHDGWFDAGVYVPAVLRSFALLLKRVDANGQVAGIQPPGVGPDCATISSGNGAINVNYAPGAVLLAASEMLKFSDATLGSGPAVSNGP